MKNCRIELWGGSLDDNRWQASINTAAEKNITYHIKSFWNGVGSFNGISSARIQGCTAELMDSSGQKRCILTPGIYKSNFPYNCGNDVVTQYRIISGKEGVISV